MHPISMYLKSGELPEDRVEASELQRRAARYVLINDHLYKRGFSLPFLKCIAPEQVQIVLAEIHRGVCGNHTGRHALAYKMTRQDYFWLTLRKDVVNVARSYHRCQLFTLVINSPPEELILVYSP
ncbi:hypothetical protein ACS0TY_029665 [Phlomoides rotata]